MNTHGAWLIVQAQLWNWPASFVCCGVRHGEHCPYILCQSVCYASHFAWQLVTVVTPDGTRTTPPRPEAISNFEDTDGLPVQDTEPHSMAVPARPIPSSNPASGISSSGTEYVIFDGRQIVPVYTIHYTTSMHPNPIKKVVAGVARE